MVVVDNGVRSVGSDGGWVRQVEVVADIHSSKVNGVLGNLQLA
jgi:hypothetical protein